MRRYNNAPTTIQTRITAFASRLAPEDIRQSHSKRTEAALKKLRENNNNNNNTTKPKRKRQRAKGGRKKIATNAVSDLSESD